MSHSARQRTIDGITVRLEAPSGFVDALSVYPSFLEEYRRREEILGVYVGAGHAAGGCTMGPALLDPFVEVLAPDKKSLMRRVDARFFEACKFEVEQSILGHSVHGGVRRAVVENLPPLGTFSDGAGWFSCCTLRYRAECLPQLHQMLSPTRQADADPPSKQLHSGKGSEPASGFDRAALVPCLTGNIVFLIHGLPVIVNIHRSLDPDQPEESFRWLADATEAYRKVLLPLNGIRADAATV